MRRLTGNRQRRRGCGRLALCGGFLTTLLVAAGCGQQPELEEWTLELEPMGQLGMPEDSPEAQFYNPTDLAFDAAGRLYVLDSGNHRVQVFDAAGNYLATRGQEGVGPGDLTRPGGMWVFADGELVVADTGNRRLQPYGPSGEALPSVPLEYLPLDVVGTARHLFVARLPPPTSMFGSDPTPLVQVLDRDGVPLAAYVEPVEAEVGIIYFLHNTVRLAAGPGEGFAVADTHVYSRIRTFAATGAAIAEIPTLYKAASLAPLGRLPREVNVASVERIAKTAVDLTWDPVRHLYWVLSGYVDRMPNGEWVTAREIYRYEPDGTYRGSLMLPFRGAAIATAPDHSVWVLDTEGVAHRFRIRDPDVLEAS